MSPNDYLRLSSKGWKKVFTQELQGLSNNLTPPTVPFIMKYTTASCPNKKFLH